MHRVLSRPPIKEALIDVRIEPKGAVEAARFRVEPGSLPGDFVEREEQRRFRSQFEIREGTVVSPETEDLGVRGYIYKSRDGLDIGQFRVDGFTYNRLAPYTGWESLRTLGLELWQFYSSLAGSVQATRVALRYINTMPLDGESDLALWLSSPPQAPKGVPGNLAGFLTRTQTLEPDEGWCSNVVTTLEGTPGSDISAIILDIDVYKSSVEVSEIGGIGEVLDELRRMKNALFFGSITPRASDQYS